MKSIHLDIFVVVAVLTIFCAYNFLGDFLTLQISLLCIMGEVPEGGSVAVAVAVIDR